MTNSAEYIRLHGHSDDYEPSPAVEPCGHPAGSLGKVEAMRLRAELGQDIWHPKDSEAMASPAASQAMSEHVIWIARAMKYANRLGS